MKVLLTTPILTFAGKIFKDGKDDLFLKSVILTALTMGGRQNATITDKAVHYALGVKVASAVDVVELTTTEIEYIQSLVETIFIPVIVGQTGLILEGKPTGILHDHEIIKQ